VSLRRADRSAFIGSIGNWSRLSCFKSVASQSEWESPVVSVRCRLSALRFACSLQWIRSRKTVEVCEADCASKYTLYQFRTHAHSERNGVVGTGTMEPETPANKTRRTAMRRLNERLGPPPTRMAGIILFA
jgi:hypothetical protein